MKSVYIANLNPGEVRHEYHATLINVLLHDVKSSHNINTYRPAIAGGVLGIYRNLSVDAFLTACEEDTDLEWYLSFDSDQVLYPTIVDDLLAAADPTEIPILAGMYFMSLEDGIVPSIFDMVAGDDGIAHMVPRFTKVSDIPTDTILECHGTGCGCLLIHKSVFQKLKEEFPAAPWFAETNHNGVTFGEDFTFCLRATHCGFPVRVHTGIEVGHVKNIILTKQSM